MKIVVAGASGLIGRALVQSLAGHGHAIIRLVRRAPTAADEIEWDPARRTLEVEALDGADAIVNLCGENVGARRWTAAQRERILHSRTDAALTLVTTLAKLPRKPRVFVSASAAGCYGNCGDDEVTEARELGRGFLAGVCLAWETHAEGAARLGIRTAILRFGVVLGAEGGALGKMLPVFKLGLGGRLGHGRQWLSWVSRDDAVGAIEDALTNAKCEGPMNVVSPNPVTNAEFTAALGRVLNRPTAVPVPAWVLRAVFGQMADETLLASTKAVPAGLLEAGYEFRLPALEAALRRVLVK